MATKRDYYEILGIRKSASAVDEIKKAYRKLATLSGIRTGIRRPRPTKSSKRSMRHMRCLSDPKRKKPTTTWACCIPTWYGGVQAGQGPFGDGNRDRLPIRGLPADRFTAFGVLLNKRFDPFEYFEQFFGGGFSPRQARAPSKCYEINVDFMDAVKGVTHEIHIPRGRAGEGSVKKP